MAQESSCSRLAARAPRRSGPIVIINADYGRPEQEKYEFTADAGLEVRFPAKAGTRLVGVAFLNETLEPGRRLMARHVRQTYDGFLS